MLRAACSVLRAPAQGAPCQTVWLHSRGAGAVLRAVDAGKRLRRRAVCCGSCSVWVLWRRVDWSRPGREAGGVGAVRVLAAPKNAGSAAADCMQLRMLVCARHLRPPVAGHLLRTGVGARPLPCARCTPVARRCRAERSTHAAVATSRGSGQVRGSFSRWWVDVLGLWLQRRGDPGGTPVHRSRDSAASVLLCRADSADCSVWV